MPRKQRGGDLTSWFEGAKNSVMGAVDEVKNKVVGATNDVKGAVTGALPVTRPALSDSSSAQILGMPKESEGRTMTGGRRRRRKSAGRRKTKRRV
jgi:hypothetical protein